MPGIEVLITEPVASIRPMMIGPRRLSLPSREIARGDPRSPG